MYEIYYNEKLIRLLHPGMQTYYKTSEGIDLTVHYQGKVKHIHSYIDKLEKNKELQTVNIYYADVRQLKEDFFSIFKIVEAAGGLVFNDDGKILMIFRRGSWDLPKGKLDPGETKKQAALREVKEETGLINVTLIKKLTTTYHIYRTRNHDKRMLKPSYWYLMVTSDRDVIPQAEEDIEQAEWVGLKAALNDKTPMFPSIYEVLRRFSQRF